jgi:hypothetical protein
MGITGCDRKLMAEIIHSTKIRPEGPWLIDRVQLLEWDRIVDTEWKKLLKDREDLINIEVDNELSHHKSRLWGDEKDSFNEEKTRDKIRKDLSESYKFKAENILVIHLEGNRRATAASFEEAFRDPALLNERSIGFTQYMSINDIECQLTVPYYKTSLELKVSPDQDKAAKGLYAALRSWVDNVKAPFWQQLWIVTNSMKAQWVLGIVVLMLSFLWLGAFAPDTSADARNLRSKAATEILKAGISETNQFKALELILSYESGAIPSLKTFMVPSWFLWLLCGGVPVCLAFSFTPTVILGIGKGENSIRKWKMWMTFVGITFPLWIVGTFIAPKAVSFLQGLF